MEETVTDAEVGLEDWSPVFSDVGLVIFISRGSNMNSLVRFVFSGERFPPTQLTTETNPIY